MMGALQVSKNTNVLDKCEWLSMFNSQSLVERREEYFMKNLHILITKVLGKSKPFLERIVDNMTNSDSNIKEYQTICINDKVYNMNFPLKFAVTFEDENYYLSNEELRVYGYGYTFDEAEQDMSENFNFQYEAYANEDDRNLTSDAVELKQKFNYYVGEIKHNAV